MMNDGLELRCSRAPWTHVVEFLLVCRDEGKRLVCAPLAWNQVVDGDQLQPTFRLADERAQQLIDALWQAGLRPTQGRQSEGVTAAQARHLEDMRAIAFDRLKVIAP